MKDYVIFSFSSLAITVIVCSLLILFLNLLLKSKKHYRLYRTDFIGALIYLIIFRLLLPIELPFTITIPIRMVIRFIRTFHQTQVADFPLRNILVLIWIIGSLIQLIRYIQENRRYESACRELMRISQKKHVSDYISNPGYDYPLYIHKLTPNPMVIGFHKAVFLPDCDFTEQEITIILEHEIQHIRNHDAYMKAFVDLISIIYWWFYPAYMLRNLLSLYLEMRTDHRVTKNMSQNDALRYAQLLVNACMKASTQNRHDTMKYASGLIDDNVDIVHYRVAYIMEGTYRTRTSPVLIGLLVMLPFLTNAIIFEPNYSSSFIADQTFNTKELSDAYMIDLQDGSYEFVIGDKSYIIYDPTLFDVPIITEEP